MKAGVKLKEGAGHFALQEIEIPAIGNTEVLVEVKVSGVCGSDVLLYEWLYRGRFPVVPPVVLGLLLNAANLYLFIDWQRREHLFSRRGI